MLFIVTIHAIELKNTLEPTKEIMKKSLLALSAVASLAIGSVAPALAYPAGQSPTLSLSSVSRLTPGDSVSVVVARVKSACSVSVSWYGEDSINAVSATVKSSGKTPVMTISTPSTAGVYSLRTSQISGTCSGGSAVTLSRSVTVGKLASIVSKLSTTSGYVSKNPTVSVSGTVKSGSSAVASKTVSVSLRLGGTEVKTVSATTNSSGVFSASFTGTSYTAGSYTAVVSFDANSTFAAKSVTTAVLKLR
jgi:xanthosine utilization system XapX-like protein